MYCLYLYFWESTDKKKIFLGRVVLVVDSPLSKNKLSEFRFGLLSFPSELSINFLYQ